MKTYIAGPMTGLPDFNRSAFNAAAKEIAASGHVPLNPAILPNGLSQPDYMCICMAMLQRADAIYMLDGWQSSAGARAEYALAEKLEIEILFQDMSIAQMLTRNASLK
ncbi:DUF4406 domain-containing protein [Yersinia enterocolitica]|uniref:DUF4406 domain-containing protein n=1 Tax=Yersinia enterocolitica TaxID=630 RepID=UPI003D7A9B26